MNNDKVTLAFSTEGFPKKDIEFPTFTYFGGYEVFIQNNYLKHVGKFVDGTDYIHTLFAAITVQKEKKAKTYSRYNIHLLIDIPENYFANQVKVKSINFVYRIDGFTTDGISNLNTIDNKA